MGSSLRPMRMLFLHRIIFRFQKHKLFREVVNVENQADQVNQADQANQVTAREISEVIHDIGGLLNNEEKELLCLVGKCPNITQKEMSHILNWSISRVKYYTTHLKAKGILDRVGTSQKGKWIIRKADYNHVQKNEKI